MIENSKLFEKDYYAWIQKMITALSVRRVDDIDFENLAEKVSDLAFLEEQRLSAHFQRLNCYLLLLIYQIDRTDHEKDWRWRLEDSRREISEILEESPSMRRLFLKIQENAYKHGVLMAEIEMGYLKTTFPKNCPWTIDQLLNMKFLP